MRGFIDEVVVHLHLVLLGGLGYSFGQIGLIF